MWLIDDCAVVRNELSDHAPPVWVVSTRASDVEGEHDVGAVGRTWGAPAPNGALDLTEPLLESARMMHTMAPMSCTRNHVDRVSCAWYHGAWQLLRLFDMVSSPSWHSDFYRKWLTDGLAGEGRRRVLITGAADYSVLAYVIDAADANGKLESKQLTAEVMDLCPTPLSACRWYADRFDLDITLHETDILEQTPILVRKVLGEAPDHGFDLIATDAFLTRFSREEVGRVLDNWHRCSGPAAGLSPPCACIPARRRSAAATVPACRRRWSALRCGYGSEHSVGGASSESTWTHFSEPHVTTR